jgi:hypothetical protein
VTRRAVELEQVLARDRLDHQVGVLRTGGLHGGKYRQSQPDDHDRQKLRERRGLELLHGNLRICLDRI